MTKRDVCIWVCRVMALQGMLGAGFNLMAMLISVGLFGFFNVFAPALSLGLYLFVWFFARGIGTELAAEGEYGPPMTNGAELGTVLLRCAGLWLFLSASITFGPMFFAWAYEYLRAKIGTSYTNYMVPNLITNFCQSVLGFLLAFTPRIRLFLRK